MATVEVRFGALDVTAEEVAHHHALLDASEREQAGRFRFERDRRRFIVRRGRLREWLGNRIKQPPAELRFDTNAFGRRSLKDGGPHFSTSHSGECMMVAFADTDVGCDIERTDQDIDWRPIVRQFFAPGERKILDELPEASGRPAFFDCWVRKEAFAKALGQGVSYPFDAFDMSARPSGPPSGIPGWALAAVSPGGGFAGSVVARDDGTPLVVSLSSG